MKDLIDLETGQLLDFIPRRGDPPGAFAGHGDPTNSRRRWGRRILLATPGSTGVLAPSSKVLQRAVMVTTEDLGRTHPIHTRMRFALPITNVAEGATTGEPTIYSPQTPFVGSFPTVALQVTVRKTADGRSSPEQDIFQIPLGTSVGGVAFTDTIPFDILEARHLSIEAELVTTSGPAIPNIAIWVECVSTIIDQPSELDKLIGSISGLQHVYVAGIVTAQLFLAARNSRRTWIAVNTSTDSELRLFFTANVGSISPITPNLASIVLPAGGANSYESPIGGYNGPVVGMWYGGTPNGFGLITEMAAYV